MLNFTSTPKGERTVIGIFGNCNAGKSSLINALTGQETALVSETAGTTTDPVRKSMELLPLGPVELVDTAGLDDKGILGEARIKKAATELEKCDIALLVIDGEKIKSEIDAIMLKEAIQEKSIHEKNILEKTIKATILKKFSEKLIKSSIQAPTNIIVVINKCDSKNFPASLKAEKGKIKSSKSRNTKSHSENFKNADLKNENLTSTKLKSSEIHNKIIASEKVNEKAKEKFAEENLKPDINYICVSSKTGENINNLKTMIAESRIETLKIRENTGRNGEKKQGLLCSDLIKAGENVILVTPIDAAAPKGRLILPQQQTIRDILSVNALPCLTQPESLPQLLNSLKAPPSLVITDSQVFGEVGEILAEDIRLTSFSILMARYKGNLETAVQGAAAVNGLEEGDKILIAEGCTHHRQCGDIGTEKLPALLQKYTGKKFSFSWSSGEDFIENTDNAQGYKMIIHCGGCMLTEKAMQIRYLKAVNAHIPICNYGLILALTQGILKRSLSPFPDLAKKVKAPCVFHC